MSELEQILNRENEILERVLAEQKELRLAVKNKNWENLMDTISALDMLSESFVKAEEEREQYADLPLSENEANLIREIRKKLLESKIVNSTLGEYISITRGFLQGIFDEALPQSRSPVYSRNGNIIHKKPVSVVVNTVS